MDSRAILHFDLDTFFVSVERLKNPKLIGKPVIVGGSSNRGVVASCSYETRTYGVRSAMPMKQALRLCPNATVVKGDMESYSKYSKDVTDLINNEAPVVERASIDEFYLDLTGMDRFYGCEKWSKELKKKIIKDTGLPISYSLAVNKLISKIGTNEAKPNGELYVPQGTERLYIAPLSVSKIPMLGPKTAIQLSSMGIKTILTLRQVPVRLLEKEFGKNGIVLHERANAIDHSPVVPYSEQKSVSTENTFHTDTTDITFLNECIVSMAEKLAYELRKLNKLTGCVTIKLRYSDFNTYTQQRAIPLCSSDEVLISVARELFAKLYNKRLLVRLIGIRFSHLIHGSHQINLFQDVPEMINLCQAMDKIRFKYGSNAVQRAVALGGVDGRG
jgi:DNA polymerase-4